MRLRVYGFTFDTEKAPPKITLANVFQSLAAKSDLAAEEKIRFAITTHDVTPPRGGKSEKWLLGIVLKVRDSRNFTKLTEKNGKKIMTAEALAGHESLAEANIFLANPRTGAGLYAHHFQSASLNGDLAGIIQDEFRSMRDSALKEIEDDQSLTPSQRKQARKDYQGHIWLQQLLLPQEFKTLVASMKKVDTVRIRLSTIASGRNLFGSYNWSPESETVEFKMPIHAVPAEIAESLDGAIEDGAILRASVGGVDDRGNDRRYSRDRNPYIIEDMDYDEVMRGFELDFDNYGDSLSKSIVAEKLVQIAARDTVWPLLTLPR